MITLLYGKKGQYASSEAYSKGNKKEALKWFRDEALTLREQGRQTMFRKKEDWNKIEGLSGKNKHQSKIVNLATFQINNMGIENLLPLMNSHGVITYEINQL